MKRNWILIAAILVLLCSCVASRMSLRYKQGIDVIHKQVSNEWLVMNSLIVNADQEEETYNTISVQGERIEERIAWESDSTNLLRWFDDMAKEQGLHLASSQVVASRNNRSLAGSEAFRPMCFDLALEGNFRALTTYVDKVESAPYALLVEKLSIGAVRNISGAGDMHITVLCLMPVDMPTKKNDGEDS